MDKPTTNYYLRFMEQLPTYLRFAGLLAAVVATGLAVYGWETRTDKVSRPNPESAIAMAIVSYVMFKASELRWA